MGFNFTKLALTFFAISSIVLVGSGAFVVVKRRASNGESSKIEQKTDSTSSAITGSPTPTPDYTPKRTGDEVLLNVPIINQEEEYACNVTAAEIVLKYRGVNVTAWDVYNGIPKQTVEKKNGFWGNPNIGYVGNIYGEFGGDYSIGYGVHWDPIQKYLSQYRAAEVKHHWNLTEMLQEVDKGNPSIVWWQNGVIVPDPMSWKSYDENGNVVDIYTVTAMHSAVVVGYKGTPEAPTEIIVSDPWADRWDMKYARYNLKDFNYLWSFFSQLAIVVR
jgi:uncharacterized protein YvpB